MTSEQWQRVKELFEEALEFCPTERSSFLLRACSEDEEIRQEVQSLLAVHENDPDFMKEPVGNLLLEDKPVLTTGQRFGHYDEISLLGEGGMGQVYLALDTRLGRKVALKLLPSSYAHDVEHAHRLEQEARAASALNHPNIVTIHEIGETDSVHFMATEFVDGKTLREYMSNGRLAVEEVLEIVVQITSALQAAHEAGIVHRDIKPENIMVRRDGVVKVLDFGLAKPTRQSQDTRIRSLVQTHSGVIAGTVGYMSPEQAQGEEVDSRTDVWSLGVVLYELVASRAPFVGETPQDVIASITEKEVPPLRDLEIPSELSRIIAKTLSKNRTQRYQTAAEMASDLKNLKEEITLESRLKQFRGEAARTPSGLAGSRTADTGLALPRTTAEVTGSLKGSAALTNWVSRHKALVAAMSLIVLIAIGASYLLLNRTKTTAAIGKKAIAVLPPRPIDQSKRDEVYEIVISEALINRIGSINGLQVRPLAAMHDVALDPVTAGKEQQVDYVLATTYQLTTGKIRVSAHFINVASGVIEDTYKIEKETHDMFAMQDAIAEEVGNKLLKAFGKTTGRQIAQRGTTNEEAYRLYLHGMYLANNRNLADGKKALTALEEAVRLDPNYARAWAGLAYVHRTLSNWSDVTTRETYERSIAAIDKALAIDPNLSEAHSALCENKYLYEWDFTGAERECRRAIELDAGSSQAHEIFARYLMGRGRHDEAIAEIQIAIDIEPSSRFFQRNYGRALYYARRFPEAAEQFERVVSMDQSFFGAYSYLFTSLALQGKETEAFETVLKLLVLRKAEEETVQAFKKKFETSGWPGVLRELVNRPEVLGTTLFDQAGYSTQLGDKDRAFQILEKVYEQRLIWMTYLHVDPRFDSLRTDSRYVDLLKRMETNRAK